MVTRNTDMQSQFQGLAGDVLTNTLDWDVATDEERVWMRDECTCADCMI